MFGSDAGLIDDQKTHAVHLRSDEARNGCDCRRILRDDGVGELAFAEHFVFEPAGFFRIEHHAALAHQRREQLIGDHRHRNDAVFRRAAGRVVENLRGCDLARGIGNVSGLVDDDGNVACAYADRRRAARIGSANVRLRAGRYDEIGLAHQLERLLA